MRVESRRRARRRKLGLRLRRCVRARRPFLGCSYSCGRSLRCGRYSSWRASVAQKRRQWHAPRARSGLVRRSTQKRSSELALRYVGKYRDDPRETPRLPRAQGARTRLGRRARARSRRRSPSRFAELGYVDDAAYALAKSRALTRPRLRQAAASPEAARRRASSEADGEAAREHAEREAVAAALRFAERRRIGPFADAPRRSAGAGERRSRAMVRAGHCFALAQGDRRLAAGAQIDLDELADRAG